MIKKEERLIDGQRKTVLLTQSVVKELQKRANNSTNGVISEYLRIIIDKHLAENKK
jgi:hypothetical protein